MREADLRQLLEAAMDGVAQWEAHWAPFDTDPSLAIEPARARAAIAELTGRLRDNYPFFHPDYAGQMLKPPHPVALAAYAAAMRINPNNHALDGGPATAQLEREAVAQIARMFGFGADCLGHLTSSGTFANLEALWVARELHPGMRVAFSTEAHYTHARMCEVLGVETVVIGVDRFGRMDLDALRAQPASASIGTVLLTAGSTACGAIDPVDEIVPLARERGWRVHADAAYGGFFSTIAELPEARMEPRVWRALRECDSIVVDPHKHGLQPYGCGCVMFADAAVAALYKHESPYTYYTKGSATQSNLEVTHLGEITLECSRAGAAAAALWTTLRCLPLNASGLGKALLRCRQAALDAAERARRGARITAVVSPELDILTLVPAGPDESAAASSISSRTEALFERSMRDAERPMYFAKWRVPEAFGRLALPTIIWDQPYCTVLRSVLMKPEHAARAQAIVERLESQLA